MNKILLVFFLPVVTASLQDDQITCSIARVDSGHDIALTCLFPEDLNVTKKDYSVYHYTKDTKPDAVIDCWWMKGNLSCNVNDGYKYNKTVNTQLTVTLSNVSMTHMGTYACQVASYRPSSFGTCQLETEQVNQEGKISCTIPLVQPDEDASLTCHYPEDLSVTKKDFSVYYYTEGKNPEAVLDCWWMAGTSKCFVNPGYTYNMKVNTQLTLNINHVMSVNTGTYACQIAGYRPSSFGTCQFETEQSNLEKRIRCFMPPIQLGKEASFSCHFPEDLSVTKKDFSVYHYTEFADAVVDCSWISGKLKCLANTGYTYNKTDDTTLTVTIHHVTKSHSGIYVCQIAGYRQSSFGICTVQIRQDSNGNENDTNTDNDTEDSNQSLAIGLGIGLACLTVIAIAVFVFTLKSRLVKAKNRRDNDEESKERFIYPSNDVDNNDAAETTFERYLKRTVLEMYPKKSRSFYFVPPVYFNRHGYEKMSGGKNEDIYVPIKTDENVVRHDRAMQHFLHCLRQMAKQGNEQMFVLTQFKYEDYLTSVKTEYKQHGLPMPAGLRDDEDDVGCFDFLIVHRHHGVLVGVVKAVSNNDMKKVNDKKKTTANQVDEAVKQLKKAEKMIKHLMSDKKTLPRIRQTLIVPNLSSTSLWHAIAQTDLAERLRRRMGMDPYGEPINHCLCGDQLSDPKAPWKVKPKVVENMKKWWNLVMTTKDGETRMNDDLYEDMIARFFGPATQSKLKFKDDHEEILPKTLAEAVSLTGDLYSSTMLDEDKEEILKHPISFLVGPPNTGKTRLLTLAGDKWLSEGHDVFIVKDATSKADPFLSQHLKASVERKVTGDTSESPHVFDEKCDLTSKESIEECVNRIINKKPRNEKEPICILLDVAHLKGQHVNNFDETLHRLTSYNLWVSCSSDMSPNKGYVLKLKQIANCPPAVVREALKVSNERNEDAKHDYLRPTDGPPVKRIKYNMSVASPQKSRELGKLVGEFLAEDLCVKRTDKPEWSMVQTLPLTHKDIFILFESNFPISDFLAGLRYKNIRVQAVKIEDDNVVVDEGVNTAWAMNVRHMQLYRMKRKIVVYVQSYYKDKENKQRAITSCTSQLILVQP